MHKFTQNRAPFVGLRVYFMRPITDWIKAQIGPEEERGCGDAKTFSFYLSRFHHSFCMHPPLPIYYFQKHNYKLRVYNLTSYSASTD